MRLFSLKHNPNAVARLRAGDFSNTQEALVILIDACQGQSLTIFEFECLPATQRSEHHAQLVARGLIRTVAQYAMAQWVESRALFAPSDCEADTMVASLLRANACGFTEGKAYRRWLELLAIAIETHDYTLIVGTDDEQRQQLEEALA